MVGAVGVVHGERLQEQAPRVEVPGGDAVSGPGGAHHLVVPAQPRIGIPPVLAVEDRLPLHRETVPVHQVPVEADQLVGRGQAVVEAQDAAVALVADVSLRPRVGEEDRLRVAQAVGLEIRGELDPVVVGHGQLHGGRRHRLGVEAEFEQASQVVLQQQALRPVHHQGALAQAPALDHREEAEVAAADAHAVGVGEDDVVAQDPGAADAVRRRVVPDLHPELVRRPVLIAREHAGERVAGPELRLGVGVVQVHVGQPEASGREGGVAQPAAHEVGHVPAGAGGLTRPGEEQGALDPVPGIVEAHPREAGLAQGQGRELHVEDAAHHEAVRLPAPPVRGDGEPLKRSRELRPEDLRALARRLHLLPRVDQPAAAQMLAEGVVPLLPRQERVQVAQVAVAGVVGAGLVPVGGVGPRPGFGRRTTCAGPGSCSPPRSAGTGRPRALGASAPVPYLWPSTSVGKAPARSRDHRAARGHGPVGRRGNHQATCTRRIRLVRRPPVSTPTWTRAA